MRRDPSDEAAFDAVGQAADLTTQLGNISLATTSLASAEEMPRLKCEEDPDDILLGAPGSPSHSEDSASHTIVEDPLPAPRPPPRTGISDDGKLIPPPKNARYGRAAEPPLQSCRPGGPRIYDLLDELPMEPFGVLAWSITQREEEIFEHDDFDDEDKVMLALWNRWILLNKQAVPLPFSL